MAPSTVGTMRRPETPPFTVLANGKSRTAGIGVLGLISPDFPCLAGTETIFWRARVSECGVRCHRFATQGRTSNSRGHERLIILVCLQFGSSLDGPLAKVKRTSEPPY